MLSEREQIALRAEVDSGSYDLTDSMNAVARATKGSAIRAAMYKVIYWLKKNYATTATGIETRQPLLTAGTNVTITASESDPTIQTISTTDTKTTVGCSNASITGTSYLVLTEGSGVAGSYAESYTNSGTYIDSSGALYVGGRSIEYAPNFTTGSATGSIPTTGTSLATTQVDVDRRKVIMTAKLTSNGAAMHDGLVYLRIQYLINGTWTYGIGEERFVAAQTINPSASFTQAVTLPANTTAVRAYAYASSTLTSIGTCNIKLEVM